MRYRRSVMTILAALLLLPSPSARSASPDSTSAPTPAGPGATCDPTLSGYPTATLSPDSRDEPVDVLVEPPPDDTSPMTTWRGTWTRMPRSPLGARSGATAVWTRWEHQIVIWGGHAAAGGLLADGATYDVSNRRWRTMPDAPIEPRDDPPAFWDKAGMFVLGGVGASGAQLVDGAAYRVDKRRWSVVSPGLPIGPISASGDWNGIIAITSDPCGGAPLLSSTDGAPYETWSSEFRAPLPPGDRLEVVAPAYDRPMLLSETSSGAVAVVHDDGWPKGWGPEFRLPVVAGDTGGPVVDDKRMAWFRTAIGPVSGTGVTGAYGVIGDPSDPSKPWRMTPTPPPGVVDDTGLLWSPRRLVSPATLTAFDPVDWRWQHLPALPDGTIRAGASAAWASGRLYLWGGRDGVGTAHDDGWVFSPALPRHTYPLPETFPGDCGGVGTEGVWRLRGDPDDPMLVWFQQGSHRVPTFWPDGYVARFGASLRIIAPDGTVFARGGDKYFEGRGKHHSRLSPCWTGDGAGF